MFSSFFFFFSKTQKIVIKNNYQIGPIIFWFFRIIISIDESIFENKKEANISCKVIKTPN